MKALCIATNMWKWVKCWEHFSWTSILPSLPMSNHLLSDRLVKSWWKDKSRNPCIIKNCLWSEQAALGISLSPKSIFLTPHSVKKSQPSTILSSLQGARAMLSFAVPLSKMVGEHLSSQPTPRLVCSLAVSMRCKWAGSYLTAINPR